MSTTHPRHRRTRWLLMWGVLATACGDAGQDYRASTDLGPAIQALGSDDLEHSEQALARVLALGADALPALERALAKEPAPVRLGVVEALERIDGHRASAVLVRVATADADVDVRGAALTALGQRGDPAGQAVVEAALADSEPRIRLAAVGACQAVCASAAAVHDLVAIALGDGTLPAALGARTTLVRILASSGDARADRAREAIQARAPAVLDATAHGVPAVIAALLASDVGDPEGRAVLARAAGGDAPPLLRLQAIHALGTVGIAEDVPVLAALDGEPAFDEYAYDALRRLASREVAGAREALAGWDGARPAAALPPPPGSR